MGAASEVDAVASEVPLVAVPRAENSELNYRCSQKKMPMMFDYCEMYILE